MADTSGALTVLRRTVTMRPVPVPVPVPVPGPSREGERAAAEIAAVTVFDR